MSRGDGNPFLRKIEETLNELMGEDGQGWPRGTLALREILQAHGGGYVYLPETTEMYRAWRNERIRAEFTGVNHGELAVRWSLTERRIRDIIDGKDEEC